MCDKLGSGPRPQWAIVSYRVKLARGSGVGSLLKLYPHHSYIRVYS